MPDPAPDFLEIISVLCENQVDFIIVGGVAAVLHGAPIATFELDVVNARAAENLERLMSALEDLESHYREHALPGFGLTRRPLPQVVATCS